MLTVICVVVLGGLGLLFGLVLGFAAKKFAVEVDPREEAIVGCLPAACPAPTAAAAALPAAAAMPRRW